MLTANLPESTTASVVRAPVVRQTSSSGGSRDTEDKLLTVIPCAGRPAATVTTATPVANRPMVRRMVSGSTSPGSDTSVPPTTGPPPSDAVTDLECRDALLRAPGAVRHARRTAGVHSGGEGLAQRDVDERSLQDVDLLPEVVDLHAHRSEIGARLVAQDAGGHAGLRIGGEGAVLGLSGGGPGEGGGGLS